MGEAAEKLSGKLGIDTTDFKTGLSSANRELRVLESGFKASAASLGDWTQSATGLDDTIAELLGMVSDTATGRIFDDADPSRAPYFALGYRFKKSNGKYRYRWYLKCRAEKPGEAGASESDFYRMFVLK